VNPLQHRVNQPETVSYIANWIELLRADDRAFFTAASQAQKAADYLRGLALTESLLETVA
jgi:antirestriction protein ArdC